MNSSPASLDEVIELYISEKQSSPTTDISNYITKYPHLLSELQDILPFLESITDFSPSSIIENEELFFDTLIPDDSDFRILSKITHGGMGIVFKGIQLSLNRTVAIKFLSLNLLKNKEQRQQFEQEAQLIAQLHHPNIVKILTANFDKKFCYYVMEFIDGESIDFLTDRSPKNIAKIGLSATLALSYAHKCGIIHRDVKPSNILIGKDGIIRLCDFGLANRLNQLENITPLSGTLRYMAPEYLKSGKSHELSDQYSLGVTLYECLTKSPLFITNNPNELKKQILAGANYRHLSDSDDLTAIIKKSTALNPSDRYSSMDAMAEDLRRYLNHQPVVAKNYNALHRIQLCIQRNPLASSFAFTTIIMTFIALTVSIIAYSETKQALIQAEQNATKADQILEEVFASIPQQQQSKANKKLLTSLLPYFKSISRNKNLPTEKLLNANRILGSCALRSGDFLTAEQAYFAMLNIENNAETMNLLANALHHQKKFSEANKIYHKIIQKYYTSNKQNDRAEVITALLALSSSPKSKEYAKALTLLQQLLKESPDNPEYIFLYARLLAANPQHMGQIKIDGIESNATNLLLQLASAHPDRADICLELIKLTTKRLQNNHLFFVNNSEHINSTLHLAEKIQARFPHEINLLKSIIQLHKACLSAYHKNGYYTEARKKTDRFLSILEFLFYNPETSNDTRLLIIEFQIENLNTFSRLKKHNHARNLLNKIKSELQYTHGDKKNELLQIINSQYGFL